MRKYLLLAAIAAAGCSRPAPAPPAPAAPVAVTTVKPEQRTAKRVVEQPGTVQPFEETILYPKVPGYVRSIAADAKAADRQLDIGSSVTKNQVLAELAVPELEEEFHQKEATVRAGAAEVEQAKKALSAAAAGVAAAKAKVTEATAGLGRTQALVARWESEADRVGRLVTGGVIDTQTRDETLNQLKSAEAGKAEAVAKVTSAEAAVAKADADAAKATADIAAAEAKHDVAKADARRVDALRGYLKLKAPFDGIVTRRAVNTGDLVSADGKHGLFAVARIDPVRVVLAIPEADAGLIAVGQDVLLTLPHGPETGRVTRTSWALEPGSRTLRVEADLPNPAGKLRPGTYVYARLTAELPAAWSLPAAAVGKINDEPVAYLVENGKAVRVQLQLARGDAQFTQVRRYKKPTASEWTDVTGTESFAQPAAALTDGQTVGGGN